MNLPRMDNVGIVVDDLKGAVAFFEELGLTVEGEAAVEGRWADQVVGLENMRSEIVMMKTPDGTGRLELSKYLRPKPISLTPKIAPSNTLGLHRVMFQVKDIEGVFARLRKHGAELVGEMAQYENIYKLCFIRGPGGIILALSERIDGK